LVGSIGVVGGKLNVAPLTEELGVSTFVLQRGTRAAWSTPVRGLNATERQAFEALLRDTYDRFIDRVATGREMERSAVLSAAEGRVMTAQDGKTLGLIDDMGGLSEALRRARTAAGLGADSAVELWPSTKGMLDTINDLLSGNGEDGAQSLERAWLRRHPLGATLPLEPWAATLRTLAAEGVVLVPPYLFSVR
jgi:protease-4